MGYGLEVFWLLQGSLQNIGSATRKSAGTGLLGSSGYALLRDTDSTYDDVLDENNKSSQQHIVIW